MNQEMLGKQEVNFVAPKIEHVAKAPEVNPIFQREEKKQEEYGKVKSQLANELIERSRVLGHPGLGLAMVKESLGGELDEEQLESYKAWQPDKDEEVAGQKLSQAISYSMEGFLGRHPKGLSTGLRITPVGGSEQDKLDSQKGESLLYSMLLEADDDSGQDPELKAMLKEMFADEEPAKWQDRTYNTMLPNTQLHFKKENEGENKPLAELIVKPQ